MLRLACRLLGRTTSPPNPARLVSACPPLLNSVDPHYRDRYRTINGRSFHFKSIWGQKPPESRTAYGHTWTDENQWMERGGRAVERVIQNETKKFQKFMRGTNDLQENLLSDMLESLPKHREEVPERAFGYDFLVIHSSKSSRRRYLRIDPETGAEEVLLDEEGLVSELGDLASVLQMKLARQGNSLAYIADSGDGSGPPRLFIRRLPGPGFPETESCVRGIGTEIYIPAGMEDHGVHGIEWSPDGESLYVTVADGLSRPWRVLRLDLDRRSVATSVCAVHEVFSESDPAYFIDVGRTKDWKYLVITCSAKATSEVWLLEWMVPDARMTPFRRRTVGIQYFVEHAHGYIFLLSNFGHPQGEYSLFRTPAMAGKAPGPWEPVLAPNADFVPTDFDISSRGIAVYGRSPRDGLCALRMLAFVDGSGAVGPPVRPSLPSWATALHPGANVDADAAVVRVTLSAPGVPDVPAAWDWGAGTLRLMRPPEPLRVGDEAAVVAVTSAGAPSARDGERVPMTIAFVAGQGAPQTPVGVWVDVYGAYGVSLETGFDPEKAGLLARGWAVVRAHVRGGGERGRPWHTARRPDPLPDERSDVPSSATLETCGPPPPFLPHTLDVRVDDLAGCLHWLERHGWSKSGRVVVAAHSAGGAVAARVAERWPGLVAALVLEAPFVDMLSAMCDPNLPLTVHEYDEWGDPRTVAGFERIRDGCPYQRLDDRVRLPPTLLTTSQSDPRVPFWGALKWACRARQRARGRPAQVWVAPELHLGHAAHEMERLQVAACLQAWAIKVLGAA